jgi:hypothetical protein
LNLEFAGYETSRTAGVTTVSARFKVPGGVRCTKELTGISPGLEVWTGSPDHDREALSASGVIFGCYHKKVYGYPSLEVNDKEMDLNRSIQPGDTIVVRVTDAVGGRMVVQLSNLNPHRRYTVTRSGPGSVAREEDVGDGVLDNARNLPVPPPPMGPVTFRSVSIDGHPLGSISSDVYDMTDVKRRVLIATSALRGRARDVFTCTRKLG